MELWIRSQDKMKLFRGIDFRGVVEQEGCSIIDNTDDYIIGTYKSIERALEVLDEIQTHIATYDYQHWNKDERYLTYKSCIYEMPKE